MRVVLDANVFVSAATHKGPAHRIVLDWLDQQTFELVMCPALLEEVRSVLTERPRLRRWIDLETAMTFIETLAATVDFSPDPILSTAFTRDPKDDYLVALGRIENADFIVTGDKDLLDWPEQQPPVVTPAAFEQLLQYQ